MTAGTCMIPHALAQHKIQNTNFAKHAHAGFLMHVATF